MEPFISDYNSQNHERENISIEILDHIFAFYTNILKILYFPCIYKYILKP